MLLSFISCSDSFFNLKPNDEVTTEKIYQTASDYNIAVMGCYAKLQSQVNFYMECSEYRSDNLILNAPTAGTQDRYDIDKFQEKASNGILEDYWANFNNGIYRCNLILDKISFATFDENLKAQYEGEALFLRALTYFNMYRMWGGVTVARKVLSPAEAQSIKRSSNEEMIEYIAGDLKKIIDRNMLPDNYPSNEFGRATSGAAKTLLGKVYLTFGKYNEAKDILGEIIGTYSLLADPAAVFDVDNKTNREIIFSVRFNKSIESEGHGYWYSISNLSDESGQSNQLKTLYDDNDLRKSLIEYIKVPGKNIYLMRKFFDTPDATLNKVGNDQIILRYSDVILMYAEALIESNFDQTSVTIALNMINQVRARAGISPVPYSEEISKDSIMQIILVERQKEFPYEGHRWFDLIRLGFAKDVMASQGISIQEYQKLYPIPTAEIERINNSSLLWQNPGY